MENLLRFILELCLDDSKCRTFVLVVVKLFEKPRTLRDLGKVIGLAAKNLKKYVNDLIGKGVVKVYETKVGHIHVLDLDNLREKYNIDKESIVKLIELIKQIEQKQHIVHNQEKKLR